MAQAFPAVWWVFSLDLGRRWFIFSHRDYVGNTIVYLQVVVRGFASIDMKVDVASSNSPRIWTYKTKTFLSTHRNDGAFGSPNIQVEGSVFSTATAVSAWRGCRRIGLLLLLLLRVTVA